jgi:membrane associated rhomboid family serine protease
MSDPGFSQAPFSWVVLAVTVVVSLFAFRNEKLRSLLLLYPHDLAVKRQYYRLLSYGFVHADLMHLMFNMIALYSIAFYLEAVMGTLKFAVLYLGSMAIAAAIPSWQHRSDPQYSALGASGAVSALFFSGMLYFPTAKVSLFLLPIPLPWPVFAVLFLLASIIGNKKQWGNIGHDVHLYGAASGLILTIFLDPSSMQVFLTGIGLLLHTG